LSGFFADSQIEHVKIERQKPRREERPRMSGNTLSSVPGVGAAGFRLINLTLYHRHKTGHKQIIEVDLSQLHASSTLLR
jgi:hypothetical protein